MVTFLEIIKICKMAFTLDSQLKLINCLCKVYFIIVLFLKVLLFLNITLPQVCDKDASTFRYIKVFAYFVSINVAGNYICMWYMSRLSVVKPERKKPLSGASLVSSLDFTSSLTYSKSEGVYDHPQLAMSSYCDSNKKPTGNDRDKNISVQTGSNSNHSFGSYFTFQDNFNENYISQGNSHNDFESKLLLGSGDRANTTVVKTRKPKCKDCDTLVPPRAKHCPICRHCVLKRDHHCFFVGCCIGYHNQRFFTIFCLYVGVGEIFNSAVTFLYLRRYNLEESTGWGYLVYVLPVLFVLFFMGRVSESALGMTILLYWSVLTVLLCAHFFCVQVNLVYHGQTKYEYMKGIKTYQGSVWRNITSVFGRYWLIGFIVPVPFLGYQSDGANWRHVISDNKIV